LADNYRIAWIRNSLTSSRLTLPPLIRVAHIITRLILGGAQENTLLTCRGLLETGRYDVTLLTGPAIGPEGELLDLARQWQIPVVLVPEMRREIHPLRDWKTLRRLRKWLAANPQDIVHTHSSKAGILGRYAAKKAGVPVIVHTIHGLPFHPYQSERKNRLFIELERRAAEWSDAVVCVADAMAQQAEAAGVAAAGKFRTIYSGMALEPFLRNDYDTAALKEKLGLHPSEPVAGQIARLAPLKGYEFFISAIQEILLHVPNAKFLFVGDGPAAGKIRELVRRAGVQNRVVFTGLVAASRIPEYISLMDVVVHASLREGLPRVIPQAQLMAKPVVAYAVDGAPEALEDGVSGYLVPAESVHDLARRVVELFKAPARSRSMGSRGRERCIERFGADLMVEKIDQLYQQLIRERDQDQQVPDTPFEQQ